ncbi:MAG: 2,3-bisphosphoglycerate-independent phosphoglycerate mutase [Leptolyngbyaceae cyanobacterium SM1_1_3]|nr:2,3-bisphosphoglycerate-independent phosphoglycerate mutase [Leptolyngbyaceae cyanobacterium SM1_1_3]NJN03439.1 2,3-bisphosphoglycerate-independent phosphoglycerate mutase [Leptolyngbyaceae cyanobacterium RM1_1_2]NJO08799.1 2,3-bisphosphoglycerate-independent phosphoglycerate mutase [Leptolyngbyaceae cyanobacterium SL_1_1]
MNTDITKIWEDLVWEEGGKIVYLILDGLGGLPDAERGGTELQVADTHNFDQLAKESSCGLLEIVGPGITPGSGPGHLALFGYDPLHYRVGRGVLSALGIDFDLQAGDVAARVNFATVDEAGNISDRRAGRIATDLNQKLTQKIRDQVSLDFDGTFFFETVSEHRAVLVLRGANLGGNLVDTDPQQTGVPAAEPRAKDDGSQLTEKLICSFVEQVKSVLAAEKPANMILLRGFERYEPLPSLQERFKLKGLCIADYPMYRGVSRLIGMDLVDPPGGIEARFKALQAQYAKDYNFFFVHVKKSDSLGEDADFDSKVSLIETVDRLLPLITTLAPDVLVVTADHSTPATMGQHSWHPVPLLIYGAHTRVDGVAQFDEYACRRGMLGTRPGTHLMGLALANAGRLQKYGA